MEPPRSDLNTIRRKKMIEKIEKLRRGRDVYVVGVTKERRTSITGK